MATKCCAVLAIQHRNQQPWVKCCENQAVMRADGIPLCGTHINKPPKQVLQPMRDLFLTVEKL